MRRLALCALLLGCNQVFDLAPTHLGSETPPRCPPIGTFPHFDTTVRQALRADCAGYTESADTGMAIAACTSSNGGYIANYGPASGPLEAITLTTPNPAERLPWVPVLAPEGNELFATAADVGQFRLATFHLDGDTWQFTSYDPMATMIPIGDLSPPSRAPNRHVVYFGNSQLHEAAQDATGTWTEVLPPYDDYPVNANRPYLSPDGLRLLTTVLDTTGEHYVIYADRPSLDARFGPPMRVDAIPATPDTFVTEDCGRVYFSGLSNILFEEQSR